MILKQLIALCTYGNLYLHSTDALPGAFTQTNSAFKGRPGVGFINSRGEFFTDRAENWLRYLQESHCTGLRLYYKPGEWMIEALYPGFSNYWTHKTVCFPGNKGEYDCYRLSHKRKPTKDIQIDPRLAKDALCKSLKVRSAFAYDRHNTFWCTWFDQAKKVLESENPEKHSTDFVPVNYPLPGKQLLFAAILSIVPGGMGGWGDIFFKEESIQQEFDRINKQSSIAFVNAILSGVNSVILPGSAI